MRALATISIPLPRVLTNAFVPYALFVVATAMLFGGGARQGLWSDAIAEILALPLLPWAAFRLGSRRLDGGARAAIVLLIIFIALPLLQLIPLPPSVWTALPGRGVIAAGYDVAGIARPWMPFSLDPSATWRTLLSLLPAAAVFLAMLSLDQAERRRLLRWILVIAVVGVCIGFLQIIGVMGLYFYAITNEGMAVGFFANGNHHATLLAALIPFAAVRFLERYQDPHGERFRVVLAAGALAAIAIGLAIVGSRAGLGLGFLAAVACVALAYRAGVRLKGRSLWAAIGGFVLLSLVALQFVSAGWQKRGAQERDLMEDLRWPVAAVTSKAVVKYFPFGTGFGTFNPVYEMNAPRTEVFDRYVNHAHNDWLEVPLEGGLPAMACIAAFLGWFAWAGRRAWSRGAPPRLNTGLARASSIAISLILLHSVVDYPLRSIAVMSLFAVACALLLPAADERESYAVPGMR